MQMANNGAGGGSAGLGRLHSLYEDIQQREDARIKLEGKIKQLSLRTEADEQQLRELRSELDAAQTEKITLQKRLGSLEQVKMELASENDRLKEEKCDFQNSMASVEAKLAENMASLEDAKRAFALELQEANTAYSEQRRVMNGLLGKTGPGAAVVPSPEELANLRTADLRAAEMEARMTDLQAQAERLEEANRDSQGRAEELGRALEQAREEARAATAAAAAAGGPSTGTGMGYGGDLAGEAQARITALEDQVRQLEHEGSQARADAAEKQDYIGQLDEYTNAIEKQLNDAKAQLLLRGGDENFGSCGPPMEGDGAGGMAMDEEGLVGGGRD